MIHIMQIYNIASPENNEYKIGDPPCRGLAPCTDAVHQFCTILVFKARYVICLYNIYGRVVGEVSRWVVLKILNHGINETLPYICNVTLTVFAYYLVCVEPRA